MQTKILIDTLTFEYLLALEALKTEVFLDALVHVGSHRTLAHQGPLRGGAALIYQGLILIRKAPIMAAPAQSGRMQWCPLNPAEKIFDCGQKSVMSTLQASFPSNWLRQSDPPKLTDLHMLINISKMAYLRAFLRPKCGGNYLRSEKPRLFP